MALMMATTIARSAAAQNPEVLKLVIMLSTNKIINTVITNDTNPSVRKLMGKVMIRNMVPMVALARDINTAATTAAQ